MVRVSFTSLLILVPLIVLASTTAVYAVFREEPCGKLIVGADRTVQPILDEAIDLLLEESSVCKPRVVRDYGPTGIVWFKLDKASIFDIYGTISGYSLARALDKGLVKEETLIVLGYADLLIYVREGNPQGVQGLRDLVLGKRGLIVAIPHPDYTAAGQIIRAILEEAVDPDSGRSYWEILHERHTVVYLFTAPKAVAYVRMGSADVGISFRTYYVVNPRGVSAVEIEKELNTYVQPIAVAITRYVSSRELAQKLMEILESDEVKKLVEKLGYIPSEKLRELAPYAKVYGLEGRVK
ncbi:MAG: substrate-binding domain-containing protein [Acidilobaceae archaeon]